MLLASFKKDKLAVATVNCYTKFLASNIDKSLFWGAGGVLLMNVHIIFIFPPFLALNTVALLKKNVSQLSKMYCYAFGRGP